MGYHHNLTMTAWTRPGVTEEQARAALAPLMGYYERRELEDGRNDEAALIFDAAREEITVRASGYVDWLHEDLVVEAAKLLGPLVLEPGSFLLDNLDTTDPDTLTSEIYFGPSQKAINEFKVYQDCEGAINILAKHLDEHAIAAIWGVVHATVDNNALALKEGDETQNKTTQSQGDINKLLGRERRADALNLLRGSVERDAMVVIRDAIRASEIGGEQPAERAKKALEAIRARLNGEFDHPALVAYGALQDTHTDCFRIIESALGPQNPGDEARPAAKTPRP